MDRPYSKRWQRDPTGINFVRDLWQAFNTEQWGEVKRMMDDKDGIDRNLWLIDAHTKETLKELQGILREKWIEEENERKFLDFFIGLSRKLYWKEYKGIPSRAEYRCETLREVGYFWECQWEYIWPPSEDEVRTDIPVLDRYHPRFGEKRTAIYTAVDFLNQKRYLNLEKECLQHGLDRNLFRVVIKFNRDMRRRCLELHRIGWKNWATAEVDKELRELLALAAKWALTSSPDAAQEEKSKFVEQLKADIGGSYMTAVL